MIQIFLDANIFFAAVCSPEGGSGFIVKLAKRRKIVINTVNHVLLEAERNIKNKLGSEYLFNHYQNLLAIEPKIIVLPILRAEEIQRFNRLVPSKDIPVLLGALCGEIESLVTLDRKHFLSNCKLIEENLAFDIVSPGEFLKKNVERLKDD